MKVLTFVPDGTHSYEVIAWLQPECDDLNGRIHPAMVICPGGGYGFVSPREGLPIAKKYFAAGYSTFVVDYPVGEQARDFAPLCQLAATVAYIRRNADALRIDPNKIAVCGFSAGGHLAASLGVLHNDPRFLAAFGSREDVRPDAMVLCYPVITADEYTHGGTLENISGNAPLGSAAYTYWGLDTHVDSRTPPAFLWHTAEDALVPVENSLKFAGALSAAKVPFELHILPEGYHGMSVCTNEVGAYRPYNARWVDWSITWLNHLFDWTD